ncbi:MAG: hypothetical protein D6773_07400, partial [Alphaproteobacteria bacterium]
MPMVSRGKGETGMQEHLKWYQRFTITHRLMAIGGLAAIAVLLAGFIHTATINRLADMASRSDALSRQMEVVDGLAEQVKWQYALALRLANGEALSPDYTVVHQRNIEALKELDAALNDDGLRRIIADLRKAMIGFHEDVMKLNENRRAMGVKSSEGLYRDLRSSAHRLEAEIQASGRDALQVLLLQLRRHEKDFMLRGGDGYLK